MNCPHLRPQVKTGFEEVCVWVCVSTWLYFQPAQKGEDDSTKWNSPRRRRQSAFCISDHTVQSTNLRCVCDLRCHLSCCVLSSHVLKRVSVCKRRRLFLKCTLLFEMPCLNDGNHVTNDVDEWICSFLLWITCYSDGIETKTIRTNWNGLPPFFFHFHFWLFLCIRIFIFGSFPDPADHLRHFVLKGLSLKYDKVYFKYEQHILYVWNSQMTETNSESPFEKTLFT